jgi:hypothetical protein
MLSRLRFGGRPIRCGIEINSHMCSLSGYPGIMGQGNCGLDILQILSRGMPEVLG